MSTHCRCYTAGRPRPTVQEAPQAVPLSPNENSGMLAGKPCAGLYFPSAGCACKIPLGNGPTAYHFPLHTHGVGAQPSGFAAASAFPRPYERRLIDWPETAAAILQYGNRIVHVPPGRVIFPFECIVQPFIGRIFQALPVVGAIFHQQAAEIICGIVALICKFGGGDTEFAPVLLIESAHIGSTTIYMI